MELGYLYDMARQIRRDDAKALSLYEEAAEMGDVDGTVNAGIMYRYGQGTNVNHARAVTLFRRAIELGDEGPSASYELGRCYLDGSGEPRDAGKAVSLLRRAAAKDSAAARNELAWLYAITESQTLLGRDEMTAMAETLSRKKADHVGKDWLPSTPGTAILPRRWKPRAGRSG